ncbi:MAG: AAA family ATPase [Desulfobulbaceae bacterium]|jgi:AAA15 family ATPase/GTPase
MLTKFEVINFKNFEEKLTFDLTKSKSYEFNSECVVNGIVNKALIYGHNGCGKSNLGFAIFDIIEHLTDKFSNPDGYNNYRNANSKSPIASFLYEFIFDKGKVRYEYGKASHQQLVYERIYINDELYALINREESSVASINAKGAENLNRDLGDSQISVISYIEKNSVLTDNAENNCFYRFIKFVNGMLFFRSLDQNNYIGFEQGRSFISTDIVEHGNVKDFEKFLNGAGVECELVAYEGEEQKDLAFKFRDKLIPFYNIASSGTRALALFYYWFQRLRNLESEVVFLFIDEFDAFYHHSLSAYIVELLKKIRAQSIITTHNTSIMTNELLRPDCYFLLNEKGIRSLANSTVKELREAHNIEKMYKAGAFSV